MNISPGLIGTYWLLASFAAGALWAVVIPRIKRATHRIQARCYCGTCAR